MKINIGNYPRKGNRRKINVQIDRFDTWSTDHTLATIIYPAVRKQCYMPDLSTCL